MVTAQTPTRVGARGARRSTAQMIQEALPDTSTAAISNDLLARFLQQRPARQRQQQPVQAAGPTANSILGNSLRSLTRQGPQGAAELQALLTYGPQSDRARRMEAGEGAEAGRDGQGPNPNMATTGTGPTPGWARNLGMLGLGAITSQLGVPGMIAAGVARNWNNDAAGTAADIGTRAFTSMLPGPVNALLGALSLGQVNPVRDMVTNPLAAAIRENVTKPTPPVAAVESAVADALAPAPAPADADEGWIYDPVSDTWNNQSRNPGNRGSGANPSGTGGGTTGTTGAVSTGVSSGNATGYGLGPAGSGGYASGSSGTGQQGGQMSGSGHGGGTSSSGY